MKIILLTAWYPSADQPVAGIFVREQVQAIALHHEVQVIAFYLDDRAPHIEASVEDGIPVTRIWQRQRRWPARIRYVQRMRKLTQHLQEIIRTGKHPDIIHAHTYQAGVPAVWVGRRESIPVVITEHWSGFARGQINFWEKLKAQYAFSRADLVMPVSNFLKAAIEVYVGHTRIQIIPNVVDTSLFHPPPPHTRPSPIVLRLLNVAVQIPLKNIPVLLDAANLLKAEGVPFHLDIVGFGPQYEVHRQLAETLGLSGQVKFRGMQSKLEIASLMRQADIFVLPSQIEMLPCALIEAQASGLPAVASRVGGIPELINDSNGILVAPNDSGALKEGLLKARDKLTQFDRQSIAEKARSRFSREAVGRQLNEVYTQIIQTRKNLKKRA